jgi:serine/threonine-protein kinase
MNRQSSYTGKTVDRYTIKQIIGKGAIGQVYEAFDNKLLRSVAIKVYFQPSAGRTIKVDEIIREAQINARIEHANIVPIYDVIDYKNSALIIMRLLKGKSLEAIRLKKDESFEIHDAFKIMYQVLLAMDFAHKKGVVHSDLKPGNIFISDADEIFILDFGLAALLEVDSRDGSKLYGTPLYMSPEQINGEYLDARSDIYSLGIILYTLISGRHPFEGAKSLQQLLSDQTERIPVRPEQINSAIPEKISDCIMRALQKNPRERYYSCMDLLKEIELSMPSSLTEEYEKEVRWDPRVDVSLKAEFQLTNENEWIPAKLTSLSANGAKILVPFPLVVGSKLKIKFHLFEDENTVTLSCDATVLWKDRYGDKDLIQVGVSFFELNDLDKQYLALYVRNILLS